LRKLLRQRARHEGAQAFAAPCHRRVVIGADLPVMRVDVIDHERRIAAEAEQGISQQFGKLVAAMRKFICDRRAGKGEEIAGQPQRADGFERLRGLGFRAGRQNERGETPRG
jgi:hypothetical protein